MRSRADDAHLQHLKRDVIVRDPSEVIAEAMHRLERTEAGFTWLCGQRRRDSAALTRLPNHPSRHHGRVELERPTADVGPVAGWAGITDTGRAVARIASDA